MQELLRSFCLQHKIHFDEEPLLFASSRHAWLIRDILGKQWIVKSRQSQDTTPELLKNFSLLHPTFLYPQPVSEPDEPFLLYPYIEGTLLADMDFEAPDVIERVMELIGRTQALIRSLVLVPFYQETMRLKEGGSEGGADPLAGLSITRVQNTTEQQREARHREMAESYRWTETNVPGWRDLLQDHGLWTRAPFQDYLERIHSLFALHVPVVGTNLAHVSLQPEHLLLSPDDRMGIFGWGIEPRPRFYMIYTYLAWSFFHSPKPDTLDYYRERLARNSSRAFHTEHHLVFALCLMEQLVGGLTRKTREPLPYSEQRIAEAGDLFVLCVENTRKDEDGS